MVPGSKPLGDSKVNSAFHPSEVDQISTRTYWGLLVVKSTLSPCSGSVTFRQLNPIHKKASKNTFWADYALIFHSRLFSTTLKAPYSLEAFPGILPNLGIPWQTYRSPSNVRISIFLSLLPLPLMLLLKYEKSYFSSTLNL